MNSLGGTWLGPANFRPVVFIKLPPRAGSSVGTRLYVHSMVRLYMHMGEFSTRGIDRLALVLAFIGIVFVRGDGIFLYLE